MVQLDVTRGTLNLMASDDEIASRWEEHTPRVPVNQTPWQEIYRSTVGQLSTGGCMELACKYQRVAGKGCVPRHNH